MLSKKSANHLLISSHSPLINGRYDLSEEIIEKVPELNSTLHSIETSQPLVLIDHCQNVVSTTVTDAKIEQISLPDSQHAFDHISEQTIVQSHDEQIYEYDQSPWVTITESDTCVPEERQEEEIIVSDKETSVQEIKESAIDFDEQQSFVSDESMKPLEEITSTTTVNELVIDVNETENITELFPVEHKQIDLSLETQPLMTTDDKSKQVSNEPVEQNINQVIDDEQSTEQTKEIQQVPVTIDDVTHGPTPIEIGEKSIENQFIELLSNESPIEKEALPDPIIIVIENSCLVEHKKLEECTPSQDVIVKEVKKPTIIEAHPPIASNQYTNGVTKINSKKSANTNNKRSVPKASVQPENPRSSVFKEQQTSSIIVVEPFEPPPVPTERATIPKPSKYSDVVRKPTPKANNKSRQGGLSMQRAEQSPLSTFKATSSPIVSNEKLKQSHVTAGQIPQVTLMSTIEEPEPAQVSLDKQDQFIGNLEEPSTSTQSTEEETKKSPGKSKKSRRSNAKKNKGKTSPIKTENKPAQPTSTIIVEQPISNIATSL